MSDPYQGEISTVLETLQSVRSGRSRVRDVVRRAIARHVPALNAYRDWQPEQVIRQADAMDNEGGTSPGLLSGIPVSVKDNIGVGEWCTRAGTSRPLPHSWQSDGPLIARFRRQGAIVTGKTHTVPFAYTSLGGTREGEGPRNPWDRSRICGGSSSGAAVSVSEGSALLALGTDTAGSVRVPAAMTGNVGLKVTHGRCPRAGIVPLSHSLDSIGLLAGNVADIARGMAGLEPAFSELSNHQHPMSSIRLGLPRETMFWEGCDEGIVEATVSALYELEANGARLSRISLPEAREAEALFQTGGVVGTELSLFLALVLPDWLQELPSDMACKLERAGQLPVTCYRQRWQRMQHLMACVSQRFDDVDVMVSPTVPITPPRFDEIASPEGFDGAEARILRHTACVNYLGLCALSLPVGVDRAGMPVGLQLMAPGFAERRLLTVALAVEKCLGNAGQRLGRPPL